MCSLLPRCHGVCASLRNTGATFCAVICWRAASSLPRLIACQSPPCVAESRERAGDPRPDPLSGRVPVGKPCRDEAPPSVSGRTRRCRVPVDRSGTHPPRVRHAEQPNRAPSPRPRVDPAQHRAAGLKQRRARPRPQCPIVADAATVDLGHLARPPLTSAFTSWPRRRGRSDRRRSDGRGGTRQAPQRTSGFA
jgi:hypothetical protein